MKTNAMRLLDKNKIPYTIYEYDTANGIDGISVAAKINKPPEMVYKTLITKGKAEHYCFIIPVEFELDLGLAAKAAFEKSISMIKHGELLSVTGYIKGGCSPIGQKKKLKTFLDNRCENLDTIIVNVGKIGMQIELAVSDLLAQTGAVSANLVDA